MGKPSSHHPGHKNMDEYLQYLLPDEYAAKVRCSNCGKSAYIAIPKGKTVKQAETALACKNCRCYTLKSETL